MFNFRSKYKLKKKEKLAQSYRAVANAISDTIDGKVLGVTSSLPSKGPREETCMEICGILHENGKKVALINADINPGASKTENSYGEDFAVISLVNASAKEVSSKIDEQSKNADIVLVNIPPVIFMADAVKYAKACGRVILFERYTYSKYKDYEDTLIELKRYGVKIEGVVTYN